MSHTPRTDSRAYVGLGTSVLVVPADFARGLERELSHLASLSQAETDVLAERRRQVDVEGWTVAHDDDAHDDGDLASAACCYALNAACALSPDDGTGYDPAVDLGPAWPWDPAWWKPTTPRRDLVKAAALILAEIDRLDRAALARSQA